MFTVKLGTDKTFEATVVEESYSIVRGLDTDGSITLRIEYAPAEKSVEEYKTLLSEAGALTSIEAMKEGQSCATFANYSQVTDITRRLLETGEKQIIILLEKEL